MSWSEQLPPICFDGEEMSCAEAEFGGCQGHSRIHESLYVHIAVSWCQATETPVAQSVPPECSVSEWEVLDRINLEEVFQTRFTVFQGCPVQLKEIQTSGSRGTGNTARGSKSDGRSLPNQAGASLERLSLKALITHFGNFKTDVGGFPASASRGHDFRA